MKRKLALVVGLLSIAVMLVYSGFFDSERVSLCKEAMALNAEQLRSGDKGRQKFMDACRLEANQVTPDQWRCVIAGMKKGIAYRAALTDCQQVKG